jgi:hypothetical protein
MVPDGGKHVGNIGLFHAKRLRGRGLRWGLRRLERRRKQKSSE